MTDPHADHARALRRRHQHERQAMVYGSLLAGIAVVGLGAAAIYSGAVSAPFLDRPFVTVSPSEPASALPSAPCPPDGTLPVAYNAISVIVLNGSDRAGLAGQTAEALAARGFVVASTGNYPGSTTAGAEIVFGEAGLASAYSLAANLDAPVLVLDTRADASVDLVLGEAFSGLLDPTTVVLDPATPLVGVEGCVPLEEARANAIPAATPTPTPTATETAAAQG
jgi:hypothetical protein